MAKFCNLEITKNYDIIDGQSGQWKTQGIQGCDAMASDQAWSNGDEAWPQGTEEFEGQPVEVAS